MDTLAQALEIIAALLTLSGIAYALMALWSARQFNRASAVAANENFAPGVSILKPLKGVDPQMIAAFASHCTQQYSGPYEILFGVSSLEDPAVAEVARLRINYPHIPIALIECPLSLGSNGKISNLAQMLPHAAHAYIIINDSDILVSPNYLAAVTACFADERIGLVTCPYIGRAQQTLWSRLESLGIATDFFPGVLTSRMLEGGMHFGLGSTLATTKTVLAKIGGLEVLVDELADDYELGARVAAAGYKVALNREVVATSLPSYSSRGFCAHQLRWARGVRDSRSLGYLGLVITHVLPWALLTVVASGGALWSFTLLSIALLARVAVALNVGVGVLADGQVLRDLALLPLRDCIALALWAWSYASDVVIWRGEKFQLRQGKLRPL